MSNPCPTPEDQQARIAAIRRHLEMAHAAKDSASAQRYRCDVTFLLDALASAQAAPSSPCVWRKLPLSAVYMQPECMGENTDGALSLRMASEFKHCPYCGKPIQLHEVSHV
jgi:hypothetical protein